MEKQTQKDVTSSSQMMEKLWREMEEKRTILLNALVDLQEKLVPSAGAEQVPSTKANGDLEAALRRISELELQNKNLQDRLKEKEEKNKELQQRHKQLEEILHAEKVTSDVERQHSEEITNDLLDELQELKIYTEGTECRFIAEIKRLEEEVEVSGVKFQRAKMVWMEEMQELSNLHVEKIEEVKKERDALLSQNNELLKNEQGHKQREKQLTSRVKELEEALKRQGEREQLKVRGKDLHQQLLQEQLAHAETKTLQAELRSKNVRLQNRLKREMQTKEEHRMFIRQLEDECKHLQGALNTNWWYREQEQLNEAPWLLQETPQRLVKLLGQELKSHKNTKLLVERLEEENLHLKESLKLQEAHTANAQNHHSLCAENDGLFAMLDRFE